MKKLTKNKIGRIQFILITVVWVLILAIPILFSDSHDGINWDLIFKIWKEYSIVFILFTINHFVLLPFLLFKGKQKTYFFSISVLIVFTTAILFITDSTKGNIESMHFPPPPEMEHQRIPPPPISLEKGIIPSFANLFIMSILLIGFDTGLVFSMKWMEGEQNQLIIEKENIENKIAFLQNQISPHFFMNTLNNIHALIDISSEEAKDAVIKLSEMMGYMLYESQTEKISLQKELDFIRSYVDLMRLRFTKDIEIILDIPNELPLIKVPPLLTISFIENAFKHGISYESPSFIHIKYEVNERNLNFDISNSNHAKKDKTKNSGLGLKNTQSRLDLIYKGNYKLTVNQVPENIFSVLLNIPI